jgi:hypothetical protein
VRAVTEVERLETAIVLIREREFPRAAELLEQSAGALAQENASNCHLVAAAPNDELEQLLLHCVEQELDFARALSL